MQSAFDRYIATRSFGSLDGLRAISVLAVLWVHTKPRTAWAEAPLFQHGHHGVTLFFAISGFLIVTLLLREQSQRGSIDLGAFYVRRALRIFPLFYLVLGLYTALVLVLERQTQAGQQFLSNLPYFAAYISNWLVPLDGRVIFYFSWSLAAEEQFYLVWPWLQKIFKRHVTLFIAVILSALLFILFALQSQSAKPDPLIAKILLNVPLAMLCGVSLAHLLHDRRGHHLAGYFFGSRWSSCGFALTLIVTLSLTQAPTSVIHILLALLVGSCVYREDHHLARFLSWRPLASVGAISYGIYLWHMLCANTARRMLKFVGLADDGILLYFATAVMAILVAHLSYKFYESWFLKLKERFSRSFASPQGGH